MKPGKLQTTARSISGVEQTQHVTGLYRFIQDGGRRNDLFIFGDDFEAFLDILESDEGLK